MVTRAIWDDVEGVGYELTTDADTALIIDRGLMRLDATKNQIMLVTRMWLKEVK